MKKLTTLLLLALLPLLASAYDAQVDGIYYNLNAETKEATVTYPPGRMSARSKVYKDNITIPETITYNDVTYRVTSIGEVAFYNSLGLTSITIPNSVTSIGRNAFGSCSGLTSVTINSNAIVSKEYQYDSAISSIFGSQVKEYIIGDDVTSIGNYAFSGCSELTSMTIGKSVTSIGYSAFRGCTGNLMVNCNIPSELSGSAGAFYGSGFTSVKIGDEVKYIGDYAFSFCYGLTSVTIGKSVTDIGKYAFANCYGLTSVTIPNGVTTIGECAFYYCRNLSSVEIPNSVTSVGNNTFNGTVWYENQPDGLIYIGTVAYQYKGTMPENTSITIKEGTTAIGSGAFNRFTGLTSITIPNSVTSIGAGAFSGCSRLTSVTIPNSVTSIGNAAFLNCMGLTSIIIPNSVKSIGVNAFHSCSGLTSVSVESGNTKYDSRNNCNAIIETASNTLIAGCQNTVIPNSVTSIGDGAFEGCSRLKEITIPNSVTSIGQQAFSGCLNLTSVSVESGNTKYDSRDNCNAIIETASNTLIAGCRNTTIPNSVTSIRQKAFYSCQGLTSVEIPNSVTSIGDSAFSYCQYITSVTIPNSVTSIGKSAFSYCTRLKSVTIPGSVTSIGERTFEYCSGLTSLTISNGVTSIGNNAFSDCSKLVEITIPNSMASIGNQAFWRCRGLTNVYCYAENVPTTSSDAFYEVKYDKTLYVPEASIVAYMTTMPWNSFGKFIALEDLIPGNTRGDVTGGGMVDMDDVTFVTNIILGREEATEAAIKAADVNKDGKVSMPDAMFIVNYIQNGRFPDDPTAINLLENNDYGIFLEALKRTGLSNTVLRFKNDKEYYLDNPTDPSGNLLYYPKSRYDGWTVFAEKDDVFRANGINNFEDLAAKCAEWYASPSWYDYVKEKGINISTGTDYENEWNVVHMFVAYHILKAKLPVDNLVYERLAENVNWNVCFGYEPQSYYETLLPGTLLKVWATDVDDSHLRPNLWVNRYVKNNTLTDQYGTFGSDAMHPLIYSGAQIDRVSSLGTDNCYVHSIDKVLLYDRNTVDSQNERMRFSQNMLLPELANNGIYGAYPSEISAKNHYGDGNRVAFAQDYFENVRCNSENTILRYSVIGAWRAFESSQLQGWDADDYDFSIRLPHVPTGKYELRICYPPMTRGGEIEYYIGNDSNAIETMTKLSTLDATENPCVEGNSMGCEEILEEYGDDSTPTGSDFGVSSDKTMRNRGFMRAPASFSRGTYNSITQKLAYDPSDIYSAAKNIVGYNNCRSEWGYGTMMLRFIVGTVDIKQGQDYWFRVKGKAKKEYYNDVGWSFNFVELVPVDVVNNKTYMEDWY